MDFDVCNVNLKKCFSIAANTVISVLSLWESFLILKSLHFFFLNNTQQATWLLQSHIQNLTGMFIPRSFTTIASLLDSSPDKIETQARVVHTRRWFVEWLARKYYEHSIRCVIMWQTRPNTREYSLVFRASACARTSARLESLILVRDDTT